MFPEIADRRCLSIKESISHSLRSDNPAEVAKMILCIAISIDQVPANWDWSQLQLRQSPRDLMEHYISTVNRLIVNDDEIAATVDGIECMMLEGKYHTNLGRPRRAWLLFRRAISFAQLIGLHRLPSKKDARQDPQFVRHISIWSHLFQCDRYISLVLGLPYSIADNFCTPFIQIICDSKVDDSTAGFSKGERYLLKMTTILTKVIDRNQDPTHMPFSATLRIDQEIEEAGHTMSPGWWSTEKAPGTKPEDYFDRLTAAFFHHQLRMLVHMPFMLKSSSDKRYQYSHGAALESSREMIKYFKALRQDESVGPFMCKVIDFQAFTAAMLLLINLLGYSTQVRSAIGLPPDTEQDQADSDLVDDVLALLRKAAEEPGGIVATQSVKALEMLAEARHDCDCKPEVTDTVTVSIPYFGNITLAAGSHFTPIAPGTYARPGEPRRKSGATPACSSLPTPPSLTQSSPSTANWSNPPISTTTSQCGQNDQTIDGWGTFKLGDDPYISFDNVMGMPEIPISMTPQPMQQHFQPGFPFGVNLDLDNTMNWFGIDNFPSTGVPGGNMY